ncbi:hypothetical protein KSD_86800 [Ktedonobacter sp. SOSP1-85]|uniref:hypothetical protein n=1 Tax=Ktedonobacter sp. SOSP1-85 TaxID=2778367 RepID=UPI0019150408|nr:hypothetical protein [Ktedonobacter sp. SOSP1-85]GHO80909.1 hypothetical protein KSD_86800 [Ktedonobacter sp. SOSP1-85]
MPRKRDEQQPALFSTYHYEWKSIHQLKLKDILVIADEENKVNTIKHDEANMSWLVTYTNLRTNDKGEQLYFAHDFVYVRKADS